MRRVPPHKQLLRAPPYVGLPIGNLSSQFFANVLLDSLDQHVKHVVRMRHYVRYVDDFVILHESPEHLAAAQASIEALLPSLRLRLNPRKTVTQPIARGIDFAGFVIKPFRTEGRRRTVETAVRRIAGIDQADVFETANSYLGLLVHTAGHHDRARIANAARKRGYTVAGDLSKVHRRATCPSARIA